MDIWKMIIEHGRLAQWIVLGGGVSLCIIGLFTGATFTEVGGLFALVLAAAFGLKEVTN